MNEVVPKDRVLSAALEWAKKILEASPDSVQASKRALLLANQVADVEEVVIKTTESKELQRCANERLRARTDARSYEI